MSIMQGLWKVNPNFNELTKEGFLTRLLVLCSEFITNGTNVKLLNQGYIDVVKDVQSIK